jgi:hypothetical protein
MLHKQSAKGKPEESEEHGKRLRHIAFIPLMAIPTHAGRKEEARLNQIDATAVMRRAQKRAGAGQSY